MNLERCYMLSLPVRMADNPEPSTLETLGRSSGKFHSMFQAPTPLASCPNNNPKSGKFLGPLQRQQSILDSNHFEIHLWQ